jgi:hypothetical protein
MFNHSFGAAAGCKVGFRGLVFLVNYPFLNVYKRIKT